MKPTSTRQLYRIVVRAVQAADKRIGPLTLGHSFATHLLEVGIYIRIIRVLLGHAKLNNTAFYTKAAIRTVRTVTSLSTNSACSSRERYRPLVGARRHLPARRVCLPIGPCRSSEPAATQGHVGH
ncbi:tyrosine-type recombinase/integrase [Sinorhizobium medicae]|uniref:tyrosine-type recombinase/integrase n=1 Tax=Sinorhizobium medicae TaxID=110321 RepID=UPI000416BADA